MFHRKGKEKMSSNNEWKEHKYRDAKETDVSYSSQIYLQYVIEKIIAKADMHFIAT